MPEPTVPRKEASGQAPAARPEHVGYYFDETSTFSQDPPLILLRAPLYLLLALILVALLFSFIGKMDVVVSGSAYLAPSGKTWNLQAMAGGRIQKVLVHEGEHVRKGQALILFNKEVSLESLQLLRREVENARESLQRTENGATGNPGLQGELDLLDTSILSPGIQELVVQYSKARLAFLDANRTLTVTVPQEKRALESEQGALNRKLAIMSEIERKSRGLHAARSGEAEDQQRSKLLEIEQLQRDLQRARQHLQDSQLLRDRKLISENELRSAQQDISRIQTQLKLAQKESDRLSKLTRISRTESANQVDNLKIEVANTQASLRGSENQLARLKNDAQAQFMRARGEFATTVFLLKQQLDNLQQQTDFTAPVDGVLTSLKVRNAGEVVGPGQLLATLAPADAHLGAEIVIANKDIGLLREGMPIKFKLDAYPYQDYGILNGRVLSIPQDIDEKQGTYHIQAVLDRSTIRTKQGEVPLRFGLTAMAEVVTEQKRLISLILEPFRKKELHP